MRAELAVGFAALFASCEAPAALAPEGLEANLRWFWSEGASATEATLVDAVAKLAVAAKADTRTSTFKGQLRERLTSAELAHLGLEHQDPAKARGALVINSFACGLERLNALLADAAQAELYPGAYVSYARTFTSEPAAYLERRSPVLRWDSDVSVSIPIDDVYTSKVSGALRWISQDGEGRLRSDAILAHSWLTAPAAFSPQSASALPQDYQVELFWEQEPGRIFHVYGVWREVTVGLLGLTEEDDEVLRFTLDDMADWDSLTERLCAQP